jgi:threonine dehydrogenase-like Zn-dependent dehydrogenase
MKAVAITPARRTLGVIDHPEPKLSRPSEVRLRMIEVGVCGTDREIASYQYGTPPDGSDYLVMGHESLGEVVEVGRAVTRVRTGDWVVPTVRRPCPHPECPACRMGRQDFCVTGDFTERGIHRAHGYMTEFVVDDESTMTPVPPELHDVAVLVEPLTIAEKALLQIREVQDRLPWEMRHWGEAGAGADGHAHRAVVLGAGPVGLLGTLALRLAGFEVWVYSLGLDQLGREAWIRSVGAQPVSAESASVTQLGEQVGGIDVIYEAAGASRLAFDAMKVLGTNGMFVFTGVPGRRGPVELDTDTIMRNLVLRNQVLLGTVNAGRDAFEAAVRDLGKSLRQWPGAARALITGRYPMESCVELLTGKTPAIKSVLRIG